MEANPELKNLTGKCGEWLRGSGPESDIVISSRIRLARNLAPFPFIRRCDDRDRTAIEQLLREKTRRNRRSEVRPLFGRRRTGGFGTVSFLSSVSLLAVSSPRVMGPDPSPLTRMSNTA